MKKFSKYLMSAATVTALALSTGAFLKVYAAEAPASVVAGQPVDLTYAAEKALPSVVHIKYVQNSKTKTVEVQDDPWGGFFDPFGFFGNPGGGSRQQRVQTPKREATGSGVIISQDGYIVTNNHVVEGADELTVTLNDNREFSAKIIVGKAGSGMHIHMRIMKDGRNMMLTPERTLSVEARKAIAGMMDLAQSITAFGNKNPMSWLRLVPHQEAPTNICWGMSNRSVLVRVPLGWTSGRDMCMEANPNEPHVERDYTSKQTVEMRSPDGSADIFQLLAGLCVACRHGFEMPNAEEVAEQTFADGDIHAPENAAKLAAMKALPDPSFARKKR